MTSATMLPAPAAPSGAAKDEKAVSLADAVFRHAANEPSRIALVTAERCWTYRQLAVACTGAVERLSEAGVSPGSRVAFIGKNSADLVIAALATIRLGAVFTPLNWRLTGVEIKDVLADAEPALVVIDAEFSIHAADLPFACTPAKDLLATLSPAELLPPLTRGNANAVCLQVYTSGTSGRPKGVMLTNRNLRFVTGGDREDWPAWIRWTDKDTCLLTTPLFHIGGFSNLVRALFAGARLVLESSFDATATLRLLDQHKVTVVAMVPATLRMLLESDAFSDHDLSALRFVYYGASPIEASLLRLAMEKLNCGFVQCYGQTETTGTVCALPPESHTVDPVPHMKSTGKPLPGVEIAIVDVQGRKVPTGSHGEIVVLSDSNMAGYHGAARSSATPTRQNGWIFTGDAGHLDAEGYLYVNDRIKDMIISGGENVYPSEIERVLAGHPGVLEAAVIGIPSTKWGEEVTAILVLREGSVVRPDEVIAWLKLQLAGYKVPKSIRFTAALPRNHLGKIQKAALRSEYS